MPDLIRLIDIEIWSCLGVPDAERSRAQRLLISLEMRIDAARAAAADDLSQTIDYAAVASYIENFAGKKPRHLLETFVEDLARDLLTAFPIRKVRITAKKFILPEASCVAVEIERKARKKTTAPRKPK